ncbi:UvrD-helicase domain-containing protein, partial [Anaerotruncus colihominis]|uniref:UvrD-helicase domain-containing protein n=1 Tax=Anaerotruncus colihominis TaxID=169435 RepID=UPI00210B28CA
INPMQYRLVRAWNRDGDELFVIGDPDQAIYSFRGSDPRCFETLARDCPDGRVIRLNENYRSTPQILDCALPVIASGLPPQERETRRLWAMRPDGCAVRLLTAETPFS